MAMVEVTMSGDVGCVAIPGLTSISSHNITSMWVAGGGGLSSMNGVGIGSSWVP